MHKKGLEMSLQFMFLIFLGTIAVVVIVGLLTTWSFDVNRYMKGWFKQDDEVIFDIQRLNYTSCNNINDEIIKHAKLCYTKGMQGLVKGQLCYGLIMPQSGCSINIVQIDSELTSNNINHTITAQSSVDKVIISYDYSRYIVNID